MGAMAVAGLLAFASCSDTWDEHYTSESALSYQGTTMSYIESQPNLTDFAQILKATGYDAELQSSQVMTVLAPANGTFNKDSILNQIALGRTKQVINRFVKNHILRYNISLGAEPQKLTLLSAKKVTIGSLAEGTVNHAGVVKMNVSCDNGVIQVLDRALLYEPNLFEQIEIDHEQYVDRTGNDTIPSLYSFLMTYNTDSLDEARSVSRGVDEDGNTLYVDSVMIRNNRALANLDAFLYREDSTYWAILPSHEAYAKRFEENLKYFNFNVAFNSDAAVRDSIQRYYAHRFTVSDLFYNMNMNQHVEDSIFSTAYNRASWQYDVYYHPLAADGLFANTTSQVECSNGVAYNMDEIPYSIYNNMFRKIIVEGENWRAYGATEKEYTNSNSTNFETRIVSGPMISGTGFEYISASTATLQTAFSYMLPNTLSGTYDIYVKFLPKTIYYTLTNDTTTTCLPVKFRASLFERDNKGEMPDRGVTLRDPITNDRNFTTDPYAVDTVYLATYTFTNSFYSVPDPGVYLKLESYVQSTDRTKFTKDMLIDCILLVPHRDTEDVAEEPKDDSNE